MYISPRKFMKYIHTALVVLCITGDGYTVHTAFVVLTGTY
jgi:hypothetical protein